MVRCSSSSLSTASVFIVALLKIYMSCFLECSNYITGRIMTSDESIQSGDTLA